MPDAVDCGVCSTTICAMTNDSTTTVAAPVAKYEKQARADRSVPRMHARARARVCRGLRTREAPKDSLAPAGSGERVGVRGRAVLFPGHDFERLNFLLAPHPNPLPAGGERGWRTFASFRLHFQRRQRRTSAMRAGGRCLARGVPLERIAARRIGVANASSGRLARERELCSEAVTVQMQLARRVAGDAQPERVAFFRL